MGWGCWHRQGLGIVLSAHSPKNSCSSQRIAEAQQFFIVTGQPFQLRWSQGAMQGNAAIRHLSSELIQVIQGQHVLVELLPRGPEGPVLDVRMLQQRQEGIVKTVVDLQPLVAADTPAPSAGMPAANPWQCGSRKRISDSVVASCHLSLAAPRPSG